MVIRKSKSKVTREVLKLEIGKTSVEDLAKLSEADGLENAYPMQDGSGVTFGQPRQPNEHLGEGLPELGDDRGLLDQWNLNLDIRVSYENKGTAFLEVARPGSGTFHRFEFSGIEYTDARRAAGQFNNCFVDFLIYYGISFLFEAHYLARMEKKDREEAYAAILESFENYFKSILKPKRKREIEKREIGPGVTVTTFESIERGPAPKSDSERDDQKQKFLADVFKALAEIDRKGGRRTQLDVGNIIFENARTTDIQSLMKNRCREFELNWWDVLVDYDSEKGVEV